jgi:hypothetical protein
MGHVARGQAKRLGLRPCALSTWTVVLGWVFLIAGILIAILIIASLGSALSQTSY